MTIRTKPTDLWSPKFKFGLQLKAYGYLRRGAPASFHLFAYCNFAWWSQEQCHFFSFDVCVAQAAGKDNTLKVRPKQSENRPQELNLFHYLTGEITNLI